MKTYNEMAENVFNRRDEYIEKKKIQRKNTVKLSVSFACMAIVLVGGFGLLKKGNINNKPSESFADSEKQILQESGVTGSEGVTYNSVVTEENNGSYVSADTPDNNGVCIPSDSEEVAAESTAKTKYIDSYEDGDIPAACYALPRNGMYFFSIPLNRAFKAYGDTDAETGEKLVYRVVVRVFKDDKMVNGKDELMKIADKFFALGYTAAIEISDNKDESAVLSLHATEDELKNFTGDEENGYFFFLYNEPDGMLTVEE